MTERRSMLVRIEEGFQPILMNQMRQLLRAEKHGQELSNRMEVIED